MGRTERVAIAVLEDRVSPVFDVSRRLLVWDLQDGCVAGRREVAIRSTDPRSRVRQLTRLGVSTLICGAVSRRLSRLLMAWDVSLVPFVAGEVPAVLEAYCAGRLPQPALAMPGCGLRRRRCSRLRGERP